MNAFLWLVSVFCAVLLAGLLLAGTVVSIVWNALLLAALLVVCLLFATPAWLTWAFWRARLVAGLDWLGAPDHVLVLAAMLALDYGLSLVLGVPLGGAGRPFLLALVDQALMLLLAVSATDAACQVLLGLSPLRRLARWAGGGAAPGRRAAAASAPRGEVFLVSNRLFTYAEAQAVARDIYGARLATPREVRAASARGADWRGFPAWADGQQVLAPSGDGELEGGAQSCGSGLYGVLVFGTKPAPSANERQLLLDGTFATAMRSLQGAAAGGADSLLALKLEYARAHRDDMLVLLPFRPDEWSTAKNTQVP